MTNKALVIFAVVIALAVAGFFFFNLPTAQSPAQIEGMNEADHGHAHDHGHEPGHGDSEKETEMPHSAQEDFSEEETAREPAVIRRTDSGYEPREITIEIGQTVLFTNDSQRAHWPASDVHPTHQIYSEFDPLGPVAPGENWLFTFTRVGDWEFHDHLAAREKGVIHVLAP